MQVSSPTERMASRLSLLRRGIRIDYHNSSDAVFPMPLSRLASRSVIRTGFSRSSGRDSAVLLHKRRCGKGVSVMAIFNNLQFSRSVIRL